MNDAFGYPLNVGDRVVYADTGDSSSISVGIIEKINNKTLNILIVRGWGADRRYIRRTVPSRVCSQEALLDDPGQTPVG